MARAVFLVLVAAWIGCGGSSPGPTWPKPSSSETDGGQSLAPRKSISVAARDADDDDDAPAKPADKPKSDDKPVAKPETPKGATSAPANPNDDVITTEEIVIEIED